ncbi:PqqD family protein [Solimonas sp. SE-A11]|uniref:PqqD family protein n=1 Tax=Solimonas sp. SE-A11 TaxID=3054954 RepID=UPI00259CDEE6|nr:PqqD family protein [Solimonas sp. SE-A11]
MLDRDSGEVFQLNASAHWIWRRLLQPASVSELVAEARQQFSMDDSVATEEIESFLQTLLSRDLILQLD